MSSVETTQHFVRDGLDQVRLGLGIRERISGNAPLLDAFQFDHVVVEDLFDVLLLVRRDVAESGTTAGAEVVSGSEGVLTPGTLFEDDVHLLAVHIDAVVTEDLFVQLLVSNARVGLDHVRVDVPARAVLDGLLGEAFADPSRDRRLPEVVRVYPVGLDVGFVGDELDTTSRVLICQGPVLRVGHIFDLMDQGSVGFVSPRVDVQPRRDVTLTPGERDVPARALDVRVFVDGEGRDLLVEMDVAHAERADRANSQASVCEEREERLVSRVRGRIEERLQLLVGEEFVRVDASRWRRADLDVFSPLLSALDEELPEALSVVAERSIGELALVFEVEDKRVDVRLIHVDEGDVCALGAESETVDVVDDGALVDASFRVPLPDEFENRVAVAIVDGGLTDLRELVFELTRVVLGVARVGHESDVVIRDYERFSSSPGRIAGDPNVIPSGGVAT